MKYTFGRLEPVKAGVHVRPKNSTGGGECPAMSLQECSRPAGAIHPEPEKGVDGNAIAKLRSTQLDLDAQRTRRIKCSGLPAARQRQAGTREFRPARPITAKLNHRMKAAHSSRS
jgi:hypothetical protein